MPRYRFGPFELDPEARLLRREGEPLPVAGKTLDTLVVLVENRGRLVDKEELLARIWAGSVVEEGNLTQTIFTVRKILGDSPKDHRYIATVAGRGYQFVAPVAAEPTYSTRTTDESLKEQPKVRRRNRRLGFAAAGISMAVLIAGIVLWRAQHADRSPMAEAPRLSHFTSYPGVETMPAFSPDGKEIAYVRAEHDPIVGYFGERREGQASIYTKLVGAATELRLTNHPGADYYPSWSPDGQYIAFYRHEPGASGFYIVSALGGQERRITHEEAEAAGMAWLPDGRHLVISPAFEGSHPSPLIQLSVDTGEERSITLPHEGVGDAWPAISPDGKTLAFVRFRASGAANVCFARLSGSAPRCWPLRGDWPEGLTWTASGDGIIVAAIHKGPFQLWRYPLGGAAPTPLTSGEEDAAFPTTSRRGNHLAYVLYRRSVNLWELNVDDPHPLISPAAAKPIASSTRMQSDPAFSPDGRKIAFLSDRSGAQEIWAADTDTQTSTQLTHFEGPPTGSPSWSPDGQQIAFDSQQGATTDVFVISADGGTPRRITTGPGENCVPSWSRDGKSLYFASNRSGQFQIWKVDARGETAAHLAIQVTRAGGFRAFESSDGRYLYYANDRGEPGLSKRNLSDGKEEPVLGSLQRWGWWALGPDAIYFLELPGSVHPQVHLKAFDIAEHRVRELGALRYAVVEGTPAIAASRDGRHVVYTQIDSMEADIMLMQSPP